MNDEQLAQQVVALGVGRPVELEVDGIGDLGNWVELNDYEFVRDWRVVGTLMEKMDVYGMWEPDMRGWFVTIYPTNLKANAIKYFHVASGESLPRVIIEAIIEAVVESLGG